MNFALSEVVGRVLNGRKEQSNEQRTIIADVTTQSGNNRICLVKAAARKRLINFARYMQPDLVLEPFHVVYYTLLDMFAHGKIRKMIVQQPPQHGKSEGSRP